MNGFQLRDWRRAQKLTQDDLAGKLGVARETIVRWEAGATINHERMLELACKQLETTKDEVNATLDG